MELDPVVIGVLSIIGAGMIFSVLVVTLCIMCNKCSKDGNSSRRGQSEHRNLYSSVASQAFEGPTSQALARLEDEADIRTLKDSVLSRDAPPTYQMATEYPQVYAGQYYIGMSGGIEVQRKTSDHLNQQKPPEYHLIVPY